MKHSRSGWSLSASLKNLTWPNQWTEVGIEDWKNFKGAVEMPVTVIVEAQPIPALTAMK